LCWRRKLACTFRPEESQQPVPGARSCRYSGWDGGCLFVEGVAPEGFVRSAGLAGELGLLQREGEGAWRDAGLLDAVNASDGGRVNHG